MFIPESKRLNVLLKEFRVSHNHMAIVVDEYGGVSGLLTIEDVLEQIVGDIGDEYDVDEGEGIRKEGERTFAVPALTRIDEFNATFGTRFSDEEFDTIGGLVLHELGRMPRRGEAVEIGGLELKVLRADRRRIETLRVTTPRDVDLPAARARLNAREFLGRRGHWLALPAGRRARAGVRAGLARAARGAVPGDPVPALGGRHAARRRLARLPVHRRHVPRRHLLALPQHPPRRPGAGVDRAVPHARPGRDHGQLHGRARLRRGALGRGAGRVRAGWCCCRRAGCWWSGSAAGS